MELKSKVSEPPGGFSQNIPARQRTCWKPLDEACKLPMAECGAPVGMGAQRHSLAWVLVSKDLLESDAPSCLISSCSLILNTTLMPLSLDRWHGLEDSAVSLPCFAAKKSCVAGWPGEGLRVKRMPGWGVDGGLVFACSSLFAYTSVYPWLCKECCLPLPQGPDRK